MDLEKLKSMSDQSDRMQLSDVPETFIGVLRDEEVRDDNQGRNCLYFNIDYEGKTITQKFTPMQLQAFVEALRVLGINSTDELMGKKVEWKLKSFRIGNPRHLPVRSG